MAFIRWIPGKKKGRIGIVFLLSENRVDWTLRCLSLADSEWQLSRVDQPFIGNWQLSLDGRWLIFVILKNPFLHIGPSDFKISIAVISNSRPTSYIRIWI
jgi:hypothetical protein